MIPLSFLRSLRKIKSGIVSVLLLVALVIVAASALPIYERTAAIGSRIESGEVNAVPGLARSSTSMPGTPAAASIFSSVPPTFVSGNPTCQDVIPGSIEFKLDPPSNGVFTDGYLSVTLAGLSGGILGSWASNNTVLGVLMKGGPNANFYDYRPNGSTGDTNLSTPINPNNGQPFGTSHISFCYQFKLNVTKTANTTFKRTYNWTIDKSVTPDTWNLFKGDSGTSKYTIAVTKTGFTDSDWAVSGTISVHNPAPVSATITGVSDVISGIGSVTPNCGVTFPYALAGGATLNCAYSSPLPNANARTNTATATVSTTGFLGGSGMANVVFGAPTTEVNASINVDDTNGSSYVFNDTGSVSYNRTFACNGDQGTHNNTATIRETGQSDSASVTVNCHALVVKKDAKTSSKRTYKWTIDKTSDQSSLTLAADQSFVVNYSVKVELDKTNYPPSGYVDSDFAVSGDIKVKNPAPIAATINSVSDVISPNINASVNCGVTFPYSLAAGGTLNCSYSANLPNADSRTNTATATQQNYSYDKDLNPTPSGTTNYSGSASVDFSGATVEEVDECVDVSDTYAGALGAVCAGDSPKTFTYSRTIGPFETCGSRTVENTASFKTKDTGATGSDNWNVNVDVPCIVGCTLTIGYWKTHAGFGPQADVVTPLLPQWLGTAGGAKSVKVTTAAQAVQFLEFRGSNNVFSASNGINKLYAQLLAAKLSIANGANGSAVAATIAAADAFLATRNSLDWNGLTQPQKNQVLSWMNTLDKYNNGGIGPGHCSQ